MRLHRFIGDWSLGEGNITIYDQAIISQIRNVFRMKVGDQIILADGDGQEAISTIKVLSKDHLEVLVEEYRAAKKESEFETVLYCAILKKENFELVVQKATELGIKKIVPVVSQRTVKLGLRLDRLEKIAREASEQSGRGVVPAISDPIDFSLAISNLSDSSQTVIFEESGEIFSSKIFGRSKVRAGFVGPEGGWTEEEIKLAKTSGVKVVRISSFTLRAETASILAAFLLGSND
jgi:16S rRNA (uracil1498-N3)-methyltransferase